MSKRIREIFSYLFWGALTTLVSWLTYTLFAWLTGSVTVANKIGRAHV